MGRAWHRKLLVTPGDAFSLLLLLLQFIKHLQEFHTDNLKQAEVTLTLSKRVDELRTTNVFTT